MMEDSGRSGADAPSGHSAEPEPISVVSAVPANVPNADTLCVLGIRVGLGAALAVTDKWDHYTRNKILALLREVETHG